ncbi:hypothetical protein [Paenibacillus sp. BAC0078]
MTQTPSRDWQKDMEMCKAATQGPYGYESSRFASLYGPYDDYSIITPSGEFGEAEAKLCSEAYEALPYWLQEAKKWRERYEQRPTFELLEAAQSLYEHHNARADEAEKEVQVYKQSYEATLRYYEAEKARADAAEARVQRLKEEIEYEIQVLELRGSNGRAKDLKELLSTLYPDTPAPKEGE